IARVRPARRRLLWAASAIGAAAIVIIGLNLGDLRGRLQRSGAFGGKPAGTLTPVLVQGGTVSRKLPQEPASNWLGRPSADGRYFPYTSFDDGNVWIWEPASGAT